MRAGIAEREAMGGSRWVEARPALDGSVRTPRYELVSRIPDFQAAEAPGQRPTDASRLVADRPPRLVGADHALALQPGGAGPQQDLPSSRACMRPGSEWRAIEA